MPIVQVGRILKDLGTNSVRELFRSSGLPLTETSVSRHAQAADINLFYHKNKGYRGPFGFPIEEVGFTEQGAVRKFAGGKITTSSGTPQGEEITAVEVRFIGFNCKEESGEWSAGDEPYFIIGVAGANGSITVQFGPYDDPSVNAGDNRSEAVYVAPKGARITPPIVLGVVAMEHDEGSPEEAANQVRSVFEEIQRKFDQVAGSELTGMSISNHVMPEWARDILIGWIPEGIAGLFGLADDVVGKNYKVLFDNKADLKEWRASPVSTQTFGYNQYNETITVGEPDEGGIYELFFLVKLVDISDIYRPM